MEHKVNHLKKYLVFKLNDHQYAAPLTDVKEVIGLPDVVPVPQGPKYLLGLINLRGKVISAIDLKKRLLMPNGNEKIKRPAVILVDGDSTTIGCIVDSIQEVLSIKEEEIERAVEENIPISNSQIDGIARFENKPMILLLNLKDIITFEEIQKNQATMSSAS